MSDDLKELPEPFEVAGARVEITCMGGFCPVQIEGTILGQPFYFRARGQHWTMEIKATSAGFRDWSTRMPWGETNFAAGWMPEETAIEIIGNAPASMWRTSRNRVIASKPRGSNDGTANSRREAG